MSKKLRIQDFKDLFGYNTCKIEIHVVELEAGENESVTVLNYGNQYDGRQLTKIPHNTPIMVQVHLKEDGYYELEDDCLMIIDQGELKEYKREYDYQTTFEAAPVEEAPVEEAPVPAKKETKKAIIKKILTKANPRRDRSKSIKVNVHKSFKDALEKEANLELEKYSLYEIPAEYYRGGYTFDVLIYEFMDKDYWGNNCYELFDTFYFYPNQ
jgi:hypothetical protein